MELTQEHVSKLETEFWGAENGGEQESQPTPSEPQQEKTEGDTHQKKTTGIRISGGNLKN